MTVGNPTIGRANTRVRGLMDFRRYFLNNFLRNNVKIDLDFNAVSVC